MQPDPTRLRFTDATPPLELWRQYPIWEYSLDEEDEPDQNEGTIRPSDADSWNYAFDMRTGYDLAYTFGEATATDGRKFPVKVALHGLGGDDIDVVEIYFASPSVDDADCWTLVYDEKLKTWSVQKKPYERVEPFIALIDFSARNPGIFPLTLRTFAPRDIGEDYALRIEADGRSARGTGV